MNRIDRLFGISTVLQARRYTPVELLAEMYGISVRTVYRDIRALCEQGIPITFEPARGYCIQEGYFLPPISFTTNEAAALLLVEKLTAGFADRSITQEFASVLNKVKSVLKPKQRARIEAATEQIHFQLPKRLYMEYDHLSVLQESASEKWITEIEYVDLKQEHTKRKIECIGLIFYAFGWHAIAWCHQRGAYRDFKVERISSVRSLNMPFQVRDHIRIGEYMKQLPVDY